MKNIFRKFWNSFGNLRKDYSFSDFLKLTKIWNTVDMILKYFKKACKNSSNFFEHFIKNVYFMKKILKLKEILIKFWEKFMKIAFSFAIKSLRLDII